MNCIILAAGKNTRLDTGIPKSLVSINGETLLSRHIRVFKSQGIRKFCIVSGYKAEKLEEEIPKLVDEHNVEIAICHNERFDLENGYSVYTAREWVENHDVTETFLTMGDHIFSTGMVESFIAKSAATPSILQLAVDSPGDSNNHVDVEDVTKVQADDDFNIKEIGKELTSYNYYDTGLFKLKREVFPAFESCFERNKYTISDMVTYLIGIGQAKAVLTAGFVWNDVDNPDDLAKTTELLKQAKL